MVYQEASDEGSSGDYYGGGQHGNRTFMIIAQRSPTGYGEGSSGGASRKAELKRGKSTGGGASSSSSGGGGSSIGAGIYQDYDQSYGFSHYDDQEYPYMSVSEYVSVVRLV